MRPAITIQKTTHVPFININLSNLHKYFNIFAVVLSRLKSNSFIFLFFLLAKNKNVTARIDLVRMSNHTNISKSEAP